MKSKSGKSEGARSGEYGGWGLNQALTTFVELSKTHEAAHYPDETRRASDSLFLDIFVQLLSSIRLIVLK